MKLEQKDFVKPRNVLLNLKELFSVPEHWTTSFLFRDENSRPCSSGEAISCCLLGGLELSARDESVRVEVFKALKAQTNLSGHASLSALNDTHGREAVLELIDKTLERYPEE